MSREQRAERLNTWLERIFGRGDRHEGQAACPLVYYKGIFLMEAKPTYAAANCLSVCESSGFSKNVECAQLFALSCTVFLWLVVFCGGNESSSRPSVMTVNWPFRHSIASYTILSGTCCKCSARPINNISH